jgi:hypothetical protein
MIANKHNFLAALVCSFVMLCSAGAGAQYYEESRSGSSPSNRLYLSFSLGEGAYFNYRCDYEGGCNTAIAAPLDFEILFGFQIFNNFYLDLAVNWSVDYYQSYYDKVTYLVGVRPGIRFYFPGLFHRHFFLRAALPLVYTLDEAKNFVAGLLLGFGLEWRFANMGIFVEADLMPYFMEVYPGYWVIPAQGRAGVAFMF